jgi:hypothetical protein
MASEVAFPLAISWPAKSVPSSFGHRMAKSPPCLWWRYLPQRLRGVATGATGCDRLEGVPVAIVTRSFPAIYAPIATGAPRPPRYFLAYVFPRATPLCFFQSSEKGKKTCRTCRNPPLTRWLSASYVCARYPPPTCRTCRKRPSNSLLFSGLCLRHVVRRVF